MCREAWMMAESTFECNAIRSVIGGRGGRATEVVAAADAATPLDRFIDHILKARNGSKTRVMTDTPTEECGKVEWGCCLIHSSVCRAPCMNMPEGPRVCLHDKCFCFLFC